MKQLKQLKEGVHTFSTSYNIVTSCSAGFRLGEVLSYIKLGGPLLKTGGPLRLGVEAPADCEALSCSLFSLCLNPALTIWLYLVIDIGF